MPPTKNSETVPQSAIINKVYKLITIINNLYVNTYIIRIISCTLISQNLDFTYRANMF